MEVRGHQMAVSLTRKQTVVWDRIEVAGNPSELAWVIPVHEGAKLELSSEKWFAALARDTQASLRGAGERGGGESGGGCGGHDSDEASAHPEGASAPGDVSVLERANIGPYDTAKLRSKDPGAIRGWLLDHGFTIPADIGPVLDEYTKEGFDFIALRVRPGALGLGPVGLQPLRLTTPGADPTLPLRMSRAGVKGAAELTLFVLGEGRYRVQGFDEVPVAREALAFVSGDSNYDAVVGAQLAAGDGRRFVVEHVRRDSGSLSGWVSGLEPQCAPSPNPPTLGGETNEHALADAGADASSPDAGDLEAAGDRDAASAEGVDASSAAAPPPRSSPLSLTTCARTDLDTAMDGLNGPLWITRLHARLPASAFAADLRFEANPAQQEVASDYVIPASGGAMIAPARPAHTGTFVVFGLTVLGLGSFFKRRRPI